MDIKIDMNNGRMDTSDYRLLGNMLAREMRAANKAAKKKEWARCLDISYPIAALQKLIMLQGEIPIIIYDWDNDAAYKTLTLAGETWEI